MSTADSDSKTREFKLPASSLEEVFKIVQGYASIGKAASLADVAKSTGMNNSSISRNVGFLLSLGLIEGGQKKQPTELGSQLGFALMHDLPDEVESHLATAVEEDDFLKNIIAAVRIRKGMDESSLRSHIAYSAGQSKTGSTTTGTGAVIELLRRSRYLKDEEGKLVVATPREKKPENVSVAEASMPVSASFQPPSSIQLSESDSPFSIQIRIDVTCEPGDLEGLGKKLRRIVEDFSNGRADDETED